MKLEKLTIQEEEAMLSVWQLKGGFVKEILDNMKPEEQVPYTTLASTIKNLERKGYVKAVKYANAKRYEPIITLEEYRAKFMNFFVGDYFKNSYKEMVSFFIKEEKLSEKELEELMEMIKHNKS
ncbi:BlaI/MecI/CopY family transcriptional regulator [Sphingobacterium litopenaei]|uniref:BlaI/MecI/CopY family transcriptional regulator n=1 Tax=Sphingobacterium litopenaei TaxID=2763500 RepID=A0ABR7YE54_9SPHI|nr:BlaI/MecI/CopY family transcriptional regulator [Sphingobacterium litopenaei]MBD1429508.1 BlaI/MecI/CopY family transcriptional regulator [Sphingobacterium litopenaei]